MAEAPSALMQAMRAEAGAVTGVETTAEQLDLYRGADGKLPADVFQRLRNDAEKGRGRPAGSGNRKTQALAKLLVEQFGDPVMAMARMYAMPLDQLVELLMIADGSKEREDHLMQLVEQAGVLIDRMLAQPELSKADQTRLNKLIDRMADLTRSLKSKPGELALKALIFQRDAAREVAQYSHSKMPVAIDVTKRADVVLNIPGLTDPSALAEYLGDAQLSENELQRLEVVPFTPPVDAEFSEVMPAEDEDAG